MSSYVPAALIAPISASVILSLAGVVGESLSFSTLQMQRRLRQDSNGRLEATYRHSHSSSCLSDRRHRGRPKTVLTDPAVKLEN